MSAKTLSSASCLFSSWFLDSSLAGSSSSSLSESFFFFFAFAFDLSFAAAY